LLPSSEVTPGLPGSYNGRKEKSAPNFYPRTAMMSVPLNRLGALLAGSLAFAAAALLIQPAEGTLTANLAAPPAASPAFPGFRMEEIDTNLRVGYAVLLVDVNGDGKKDIVVGDTTRVVWYESPSWKQRVIIEGGTRADNVCIAA